MAKFLLYTALGCLCVFYLPIPAVAQWVLSNGSNGGSDRRAYCLGVNGANVFAGTDDGLIHTSNNGASWENISHGLSSPILSSLAFKGSTIFAGSHGNGVDVSMDDGASWAPRNNGLTRSNIFSLVTMGSRVLASTDSGVFLSTNSGMYWEPVDSNLDPYLTVHSFVVSSVNILATSNYKSYLSKDSGATWTPIDSVFKGNNLWAFTDIDSSLVAVTDSGFYRSTDYGMNWSRTSAVLPPVAVWPASTLEIFAVDSTLFAGSRGQGVYRSTDDGASWISSNIGLTSLNVWVMAFNSMGIFVGTDHGTFLSSDRGASWSATRTGIPSADVLTLAKKGGTLFAGTNGYGVYRSTDQGSNWTSASAGINPGVRSLAVSDSAMLAGTDNGVYRSTDDGANWSRVTDVPGTLPGYAVTARDSFMLAGEGPFVYRSSDNGLNWTSVSNGLPFGFTYSFLWDKSDLFVGNRYGVWMTTNNGASWLKVDSMSSTAGVKALAVQDTFLLAAFSEGWVFRYRHVGADWVKQDTIVANIGYSASFLAVDSVVVDGTTSGVFVSRNYGTSWTSESPGLPPSGVSSFVVSNGILFAGARSGAVYKRPLSDVITSVKLDPITGSPDHPYLLQNYPNPFNPSTVIQFHVPRLSRVTMKFYDLVGREVGRLLDVSEYEPGTYQVRFDGSHLASGVYFYALTGKAADGGSFGDVKKMLIMK